jgi:hypothetical protein
VRAMTSPFVTKIEHFGGSVAPRSAPDASISSVGAPLPASVPRG